jgi:KDO2-lipid IV(A) lauroyltransferase
MNPLVLVMRLLALLPLSWLRGLGWLLGQVLFHTSARRGRVVATNIGLCFPDLNAQQQRALRQQHFVYFAQSFLDRAWLWHASEDVVAQRFQFEGHFHNFQDPSPLIVLAPHFVGLDAGGLAMTLLQQARMSCVYVPLKNKRAEAWMTEGRKRSGRVLTIARKEGPMPMIKSLKDGWRLHFSPDMDFGINGSVWSAFFGVKAATPSSLSRIAKLGRARVCTVVTRLTPQGYTLVMGPVWEDFPTQDVDADTQRMNLDIETWVRQAPAQYYWVHKRFKTRPPGEPSFYQAGATLNEPD